MLDDDPPLREEHADSRRWKDLLVSDNPLAVLLRAVLQSAASYENVTAGHNAKIRDAALRVIGAVRELLATFPSDGNRAHKQNGAAGATPADTAPTQIGRFCVVGSSSLVEAFAVQTERRSANRLVKRVAA